MSLVNVIANEFSIPVINDDHKIWFFRTKAGKYYHDFKVNNFIALGWNLLPPDFITDDKTSRDQKKVRIEEIYPDEKRPGLILGQIETFYTKMNEGDLVAIPAEGGKEISIGQIGVIQTEVKHQIESEEYPQCEYVHKRAVEWKKVIDVGKDIYLFKALRAQQTISDLSDCGDLILRNLFPIYVAEDGIHVTLQKETSSNLSLYQNVDLHASILSLMDGVSSLYGKDSFRMEISIKTAVGSPGFMEFILPAFSTPLIGALVFKFVIGKEKSQDGTSTGILGLITKINELVNDYHNRKKTDAETQLLLAQAKKTQAETDLTQAQAEKLRAETRKIEIKYEQIEMTPSGKTTAQIVEESENIDVPTSLTESDVRSIEEFGKSLCAAAEESGISFDGKRVHRAGRF